MREKLQGKIAVLVLLVFVFLLFLVVLPTDTEVKGDSSHFEKINLTVYLAGDSTVSTYSWDTAPRAGWGQFLSELFTDRVIVENQAKSGRSSKSFVEEGRLDEILNQINKGDYLFIQFGHNDKKSHDPKRYTNPYTTYQSYLKQYIDGARAKQAFPVLITPVETRTFNKKGIVLDSHGDYPAAMKELGIQEEVPVIDLTTKSKEFFQELGPDKTKKIFLWFEAGEHPNYPKGIQDNVHFQQAGAVAIARQIIEGIEELNLAPLKNEIIK